MIALNYYYINNSVEFYEIYFNLGTNDFKIAVISSNHITMNTACKRVLNLYLMYQLPSNEAGT